MRRDNQVADFGVELYHRGNQRWSRDRGRRCSSSGVGSGGSSRWRRRHAIYLLVEAEFFALFLDDGVVSVACELALYGFGVLQLGERTNLYMVQIVDARSRSNEDGIILPA